MTNTNTIKILAIVATLSLFGIRASAQNYTWYRDADADGWGDPAISTSATAQPTGYVLNKSDCDDTRENITVWQSVGNPGFSAGQATNTSLSIDTSGIPYVVYTDNAKNGKATVKRFINNAWTNVGVEGFTSGIANYTSIATDVSGTPYVAFMDGANNDKATVMKYNGAAWVTVGTAGFSSTQAKSTDIRIDSAGALYVTYQNGYTSNSVTVMKYNGTSWNNMGTFSGARSLCLALDKGGIPYIAYADSVIGYKFKVKKYDGTNWISVGSSNTWDGEASSISIIIDAAGMPYVSYLNNNYGMIDVEKYDGSNWSNLGLLGGRADRGGIAIGAENNFFQAYRDWNNYNKATVRKNGYLSEGFSAAEASFLSITLDPSGIPYVVFQDWGNDNKITVMKPGIQPFTSNINISASTMIVTSGTITFSAATVNAGTSPVFQWYRNGQLIAGAGSTTYSSSALSIGDTIYCLLKPSYQLCTDTTPVYSNKIVLRAPLVWYADNDGDGWGNSAVQISSATKPGGYVINKSDCDDSKSNTTTWSNIGAPGFFVGRNNPVLALDKSGTPYVLYQDSADNYKSTVKKYDGNNWILVGTSGISSEYTTSTLALDDQGSPYVAYVQDVQNIVLKKYNGSNWIIVGTITVKSTSLGLSPKSLVIDKSGIPYIAYIDVGRVTVKKLIGNNWITIGSEKFSKGAVRDISLIIDPAGLPYVAYGGMNDGIVVMRFNGTKWVTAGSGAVSDYAYLPDMVLDGSGTPYVIFQDWQNAYKASVMKLSGSSWINIGTGISNEQADQCRIAVDMAGTPYVAYIENDNTVVKKYDGSSWLTISNAAISGGTVTNLIMDASYGLYMLYTDIAGNKGVLTKQTVQLADAFVTISASDTVTTSGKSVTFIATPGSGGINASYQWYKNGLPIPGAGSANYTTSNLVSNDTIYCQMMSNEKCVIPKVYSNKIHVMVKPVFTWYQDIDGDGWGNAAVSLESATRPAGYVLNKFDCDDNRSNGKKWDTIGTTEISTVNAYNTQIITDADGKPYIIYTDSSNSNRVVVKKFENNNWSNIGETGITSNNKTSPVLVIGADMVLYIAYIDYTNNQSVVVKKYNGSTWVNVGPGVNSYVDFMDMSVGKNGDLYVAYTTSTNVVGVKKYNGSAWVAAGSFSNVYYGKDIKIKMDTLGRSYILYKEYNYSTPVVIKLDGTQWKTLGSLPFPDFSNFNINLLVDGPGNVYIAYCEGTVQLGFKATVKKFDGTNWITLGPSEIPSGYYTSFAVDIAGKPYIAYRDYGSKIPVVKSFNGTAWDSLGNIHETASDEFINIAVGDMGLPYLAYSAVAANGRRAIVRGIHTKPLNSEVNLSASDSVITAGKDVTFTAYAVNGGMNPDFKWYKNDTLIIGATDAVYTTNLLRNKDEIYCTISSSDSCTDSAPVFSNKIEVSVITGVYELASSTQMEMKIYPVPANDMLHIQWNNKVTGSATLTICDITGKQVLTSNHKMNQANETISLAVNELKAGVYFIKATVNGQAITPQKFIKN